MNKFIDNLKDCPVCRQSLKNDKVLSNGAHLVNHFKENFERILNLKDRENDKNFKCTKCNQECPDSMALMLHFGLTHGEIERQISNDKKKRLSLKNIILKVDKMTGCKVCGMVYSDHMMGKPEIRKHLFAEHRFQDDILQKVTIFNPKNF